MTVFSRTHHTDGDITEIVQHADGRVGIWSPVKRQWVTVWGNGRNQAGFRNALESDGLTSDGEAQVAAWGAAING